MNRGHTIRSLSRFPLVACSEDVWRHPAFKNPALHWIHRNLEGAMIFRLPRNHVIGNVRNHDGLAETVTHNPAVLVGRRTHRPKVHRIIVFGSREELPAAY